MEKILEKVKSYIDSAIIEHLQNITNDDLYKNGAVYYANGNDGTDFDWEWNGRTCEFFKYYKSTEYGACKVFVNCNGYIEGYIYPNFGKGTAIDLKPKYIGKEVAKDFAKWLLKNRDFKDLFDEII